MKKYLIVLFTACLLISCGNKKQSHKCVKEIIEFVQVQKDSSMYYSEEEWSSANARFTELIIEAKMYEDDLSNSEKWRLGKASTEFVLLQLNRDSKKIKSEIMKELNNY